MALYTDCISHLPVLVDLFTSAVLMMACTFVAIQDEYRGNMMSWPFILI